MNIEKIKNIAHLISLKFDLKNAKDIYFTFYSKDLLKIVKESILNNLLIENKSIIISNTNEIEKNIFLLYSYCVKELMERNNITYGNLENNQIIILEYKNKRYNDAYKIFGHIGILQHIIVKIERLITLIDRKENEIETFEDSLSDVINYILLYFEIKDDSFNINNLFSSLQ